MSRLWGHSIRALNCCHGRRGRLAASLFMVLASLLSTHPLQAQDGRGQVAGTVVQAESGTPLGGVRVYLEGTAHSAITTESGQFLISGVVAGRYRIRASGPGYSDLMSREVVVSAGSTTTLSLELESHPVGVEGISAVGGIDRAPGLRGIFPVGRVGAEDLSVPTTSADAAVQGRVAGVQVVRGHSTNSPTSVQIRSPNSIFGSNAPLYIVDGVPLSRLANESKSDIESLDIERVEVIKGTAAAALYGSRARNGAISITTRRGLGEPEGRPRLSVRSEFGLSRVSETHPLARHHYLMTDADGRFTDLDGSILPDQRVGREIKPDRMMDAPWGTTPIYDNAGFFFRSGQFRANTFSVAQNTGLFNYNASFTDYRSAGIMRENDGFDRNSFRLNLDLRPLSIFSARFSGYHTESSLDPIVGTPFEDLVRYFPDVDLGAPGTGGNRYVSRPDSPFINTVNPLYRQTANDHSVDRIRTLAGLDLQLRPVSWFTLGADFSYDRARRELEEYQPAGTTDPDWDNNLSRGRYRTNEAEAKSLTAALTASVTNSVGPLRARTFLRVAGEREEREVEDRVELGVAGKGFELARNQDLERWQVEGRTNSQLAGTALSIDDRYFADLMVRRETPSFIRGREPGTYNYYRAALNWRVSEEPWFRVPGVREFQIRLSRGTAGSYLGDNYVLSQQKLGNDLRPEQTTDSELSIRTLLGDRLSLDLTYVESQTDDQMILGPNRIWDTGGVEIVLENRGKLSGSTYEAAIEAILISRGELSWRSTLVLDRSRLKIDRFGRACYMSSLNNYCDGSSLGDLWTTRLHRKPEELSYRHDQETLKQFQTNDEGLLVWVGEGNSWRDGMSKGLWGTTASIDGFDYAWGIPFQEVSTTGVPVRAKHGSSTPDLGFGWGNSVRYARISVFAQVHGQYGGQIYNSAKSRLYNRRRHADVDQAGKPTELKKPIDYYVRLYNGGAFTDIFIEDATYAKLSELAVRYDLRTGESALLSRLGVSNLSLGLIGRNLYTLTSYSGLDPEVGTVFNRRDAFAYPASRTISGEIRVGF